jgi:diguanylate cyclase (GGDEF)-like protein
MRQDVFAAQRRHQRLFLVLVLSAVAPLVIITYLVYVHVLPVLNRAEHRLVLLGLQLLVLFTSLLMAAGGYTYRRMESASAELQELSFTDEVTGLYNRRFFSIRLAEEIGRHRRFRSPVAVVLLDLDGFKAINDQWGHAAGDQTLQEVARLLQEHSRGVNVLARYGGDEFVVLMVETTRAGALQYAERIRQVLAAHQWVKGARVTASLGVAAVPDDATTGEDVVRVADAALYAAKRAGKNAVMGHPAADGRAGPARPTAHPTST